MIFKRSELDRLIDLILKDFDTEHATAVHSFSETVSESDDVEYEDEKVEAPSFDEVLVKGPAVFRRTYEGWESQRIENPTVADLFRQFQTSMTELGDFHHVFCEGFGVQEKGNVTPCKHCGRGEGEPEVTFIDIYTGS
jgi:hypothetical protein